MNWAPLLVALAAGCGSRAAESPRATAHESCLRLEKWLVSDPEEANRATAAETLGGLREDPECAVRALVKALREDNGWLVPEEALKALGKLGPLAVPAVDDLMLLERGNRPPLDPDHLRDTLVKIGPGGIPRLIFHLRMSAPTADEDTYGTSGFASSVLARLGKDSVQPLVKAMSDPVRRDSAVATLSNLGPVALDAAPALIELYGREDAPRITIIQALYNMGNTACVARDFLRRLSASGAPEVQGYVRLQVDGALANLRDCPAG